MGVIGKFSGKVVLITGGSRGQGAAHSRVFVEEGAEAEYRKVIDINQVAVFLRMKAVIPSIESLN